ncbi:hypothetical protein [Streptomyces spiralis]
MTLRRGHPREAASPRDTCRLDLPGFGLRWVDSCRDYMIAGFKLEQP